MTSIEYNNLNALVKLHFVPYQVILSNPLIYGVVVISYYLPSDHSHCYYLKWDNPIEE